MRQFTVLAIAFLLFACKHQKPEISLKLIPVKQGEYWGYVDKDGKYLINPQFKKAYLFTEGLALIQNTEGKYGYINEDGKIMIPTVYKSANCFKDGLAAVVKENQKIEFIDHTGKTILTLDANMEAASNFNDGLSLVKINGKWNVIDKTGKVVITNQYEHLFGFSDGLALIAQVTKDKTQYGYIDKTGKIVITPQFEDANFFYEGMAAIRVDKKYGFIDKTGKIVINPQFDDISIFSQDLAAVKQGELWGFINKEGKIVINPQFKNAYIFTRSGLCPVRSTTNDKWGFIDKDGKMKIEPQFENVNCFYDGISVTELNDKYGVINTEGKYLTNPVYDEVELNESPLYSVIESDYFDISVISSLLFKDINPASIRGLQRGISFATLQAQYPGLTHDNYYNFRSVGSESNTGMELSSINFAFASGFETFVPKYRKELRYNYYTGSSYYEDVYDGLITNYNDFTPLQRVVFNFDLTEKAKKKSNEIISGLKARLPADFRAEFPDDHTILLDKDGFSLAIVKKSGDDVIHLVMTFDRSSMDEFRNINSGEPRAAVDTTAKADYF